jgi:transcriptional regulator GlxA family with amidase domain
MVVPPPAAQAQFIEAPMPKVPTNASLEPMLSWLMANLDRPLQVDILAERAHMAPRTFARRFRAEVGTTPHDWVTNQRILLARRLLEDTDLGVESVAVKAGFGDAATRHFTRRVGATPHAYRTTFRRPGHHPA